MSEELITPENLSKELLKATMDAAFIESSYDSDGDIKVRDVIVCWVLPNVETKDRIKFLAQFGFQPTATQMQRLECVNKINSEYILLKTVVGSKNNVLRVEYDLLVTGGITKKAFVYALKRFCSIPRAAISEHGAGIVQ